MQHKVNDSLTIEIKDKKTYWISKAVKNALLDWVIVREWESPEMPASNFQKSQEVLILWMTNLTESQLNNDLTEEEVDLILNKINEIATAPTIAS